MDSCGHRVCQGIVGIKSQWNSRCDEAADIQHDLHDADVHAFVALFGIRHSNVADRRLDERARKTKEGSTSDGKGKLSVFAKVPAGIHGQRAATVTSARKCTY